MNRGTDYKECRTVVAYTTSPDGPLLSMICESGMWLDFKWASLRFLDFTSDRPAVFTTAMSSQDRSLERSKQCERQHVEEGARALGFCLIPRLDLFGDSKVFQGSQH